MGGVGALIGAALAKPWLTRRVGIGTILVTTMFATDLFLLLIRWRTDGFGSPRPS